MCIRDRNELNIESAKEINSTAFNYSASTNQINTQSRGNVYISTSITNKNSINTISLDTLRKLTQEEKKRETNQKKGAITNGKHVEDNIIGNQAKNNFSSFNTLSHPREGPIIDTSKRYVSTTIGSSTVLSRSTPTTFSVSMSNSKTTTTKTSNQTTSKRVTYNIKGAKQSTSKTNTNSKAFPARQGSVQNGNGMDHSNIDGNFKRKPKVGRFGDDEKTDMREKDDDEPEELYGEEAESEIQPKKNMFKGLFKAKSWRTDSDPNRPRHVQTTLHYHQAVKAGKNEEIKPNFHSWPNKIELPAKDRAEEDACNTPTVRVADKKVVTDDVTTFDMEIINLMKKFVEKTESASRQTDPIIIE
eukprot:TRINITY_DN3341_c0_g1_i4.p1 TRINITY_DN3341_c0_g1~~TRINITY_DN3341_c0_g1_i4.p1  ORF type:complete len:359 (+),score=63.34 TRINITY_DN3341_c0_g1_i4:82-1158(+)